MGLTIAVCICEKDKSFVIWQQITNNQVQVYYSVDSTHEHLIVFSYFGWLGEGGCVGEIQIEGSLINRGIYILKTVVTSQNNYWKCQMFMIQVSTFLCMLNLLVLLNWIWFQLIRKFGFYCIMYLL